MFCILNGMPLPSTMRHRVWPHRTSQRGKTTVGGAVHMRHTVGSVARRSLTITMNIDHRAVGSVRTTHCIPSAILTLGVTHCFNGSISSVFALRRKSWIQRTWSVAKRPQSAQNYPYLFTRTRLLVEKESGQATWLKELLCYGGRGEVEVFKVRFIPLRRVGLSVDCRGGDVLAVYC